MQMLKKHFDLQPMSTFAANFTVEKLKKVEP
jgi:hypothetical protein